MGPAFTLAILVVIAGLATIVTFVITVFFLPFRSALLFSPLFVGAGMAGCVFGLVIQLPFPGRGFQTSFGLWRFLGIVGVGGCASSFVASVLFLRIRRAVLLRVETATNTKLFD